MIHQLAQVLAKVLKLNQIERFDDALDEIQRSSKQLVGMDLQLLTTLSDSEHIRLLSLGNRFEVEKCVVAAELLRLTGDVKELQKNDSERYHCYSTSLSLFLELLFRESEILPKEYFDKIDLLIGNLAGYELSPALLQKLFRFYGIVGRYDAAENTLFDLVGRDAAFCREGVRFYERLRTKSDEELERGNLPRGEVEAGLKELLGKMS